MYKNNYQTNCHHFAISFSTFESRYDFSIFFGLPHFKIYETV